MMAIVSAIITCSLISILKAKTLSEYILGWTQQGQREPTESPLWGPFDSRSLDRGPSSILRHEQWEDRLCPGDLGIVVGLST